MSDLHEALAYVRALAGQYVGEARGHILAVCNAADPERYFRGERIMTDCQAMPLLVERFYWTATLYGYGGDPSEPIGYGENEAAAIADLKEQLEDRDDDT